MFLPVDFAEAIDPADFRLKRLAALADRRWRATQTMTFDGVTDVPADPAMAVVNATLSMRERQGVPAGATQIWKLRSPDVFRTWAHADIEAYGFAIGAHIQACFDREAELAALMPPGATVAALAAVDISSGWP